MGPIFIAAVGAFLILRPRSGKGSVNPARLPATLSSLYAAGQAPVADPLADPGLSQQICSEVAARTAAYTGASAETSARVGGMSAYLTQPVCAVNVKLAQYGIQEGRQLVSKVGGALSDAGSAFKSMFDW